MTAEVAVLNKAAIALAADSAVTVNQQGEQKIYNTTNKLFALSDYHPIGIMVFGNAEIMGVPWETIIKVFRRTLERKSFKHLSDYSREFISFLSGNTSFFPEKVQEDFFHRSVASFFALIRKDIDKKVADLISSAGSISEAKVSEITEQAVRDAAKWVESANRLPSVPDGHEGVLAQSYGTRINQAIDEVFEKLPLETGERALLSSTAASLFTRQRFSLRHSGVVVAGFGDDDVYPSVVQHNMDGLACGVLKYESHEDGISLEQSSLIIPFAQRETVDAFMMGMNPELETVVHDYLKALFSELPQRVAELTSVIYDVDPKKIHDSLQEITDSLYESFREKLEEQMRSKYVDPVLNAVESLPKDELAAMAESLVNLTSFRQKVSLEAETVGGPIDVAVISKGDGFVWIKRKHYFNPELNPRFVAKYYRQDQ